MKIDAAYHAKAEQQPERRGDPATRRYSKDPVHHPLLLEREYTRALNAVKLERLFAKPFITALGQRGEGICALAKSASASVFAAASYDGRVSLWDLHTRALLEDREFPARVTDVAVDDTVGLFVPQNCAIELYARWRSDSTTCTTKYIEERRSHAFTTDAPAVSIDFSRHGVLAAASPRGVQFFDVGRGTAQHAFPLRDAAKVATNPSLINTLGAVAPDGVHLFDSRVCREFACAPLIGAACLAFNPQHGHTFAVGANDGNAYTFDMRATDRPLNTLRGHVGAVVSLSYAPTGAEVATGSFDKTIRIFQTHARKSRDCYYNDRMHIVYGLAHSNDGQFIVSGSDDGSLRLWKANASQRTGPTTRREREAAEYRDALKEKFRDVAEIARITRHRFLPRPLKQQMRTRHEAHEAAVRRAERVAAERAENEDPRLGL